MWAQQRHMQEQILQHHGLHQPLPPSNADNPPLPNDAAPPPPPPPVVDEHAPFIHSERLKKMHEEDVADDCSPQSWNDHKQAFKDQRKKFVDNGNQNLWKPFGNLDYSEGAEDDKSFDQGSLDCCFYFK